MSASVRFVSFCLIASLVVAIPSRGIAQDPAPENQGTEKQATEKTGSQEETPAPAIDPRLRQQLGSPQHMMRTFLLAVNENRLADAANCLDFGGQTLTEEAKASGGGKLVMIRIHGRPL